MAATPSIRVLKNLSYRGNPIVWSNRYHFNGGLPADGAHWTTLSDAIVTAEKAVLPTNQQIVQTYGYAAGSDVPIFAKTYTTNGTYSFGTLARAPGDAAALVRYATTARTPKNHPIYLFNYYHAVYIEDQADPDVLAPTQKTAFQTYATAWIAGFSDGANSYTRAGPNGASAVGSIVNAWLTHRDFPR